MSSNCLRKQPRLKDRFDVNADGVEYESHDAGQDSTAESDQQVQRGQSLSVAMSIERIDIGKHSCHDKRQDQPADSARQKTTKTSVRARIRDSSESVETMTTCFQMW